MPDFREVKPGMRVFYARGPKSNAAGHNADVVRVDDGLNYPVAVEFRFEESIYQITTTYDGFEDVLHAMPTLFWREPDWKAVDPPHPKRKVTKWVRLIVDGGDVLALYDYGRRLRISTFESEVQAKDFAGGEGIAVPVEVDAD